MTPNHNNKKISDSPIVSLKRVSGTLKKKHGRFEWLALGLGLNSYLVTGLGAVKLYIPLQSG